MPAYTSCHIYSKAHFPRSAKCAKRDNVSYREILNIKRFITALLGKMMFSLAKKRIYLDTDLEEEFTDVF